MFLTRLQELLSELQLGARENWSSESHSLNKSRSGTEHRGGPGEAPGIIKLCEKDTGTLFVYEF